MFRELSKSEAAKRGLPSKSPVAPYEDVVWAEEAPSIETLPARATPVGVLLRRAAA